MKKGKTVVNNQLKIFAIDEKFINEEQEVYYFERNEYDYKVSDIKENLLFYCDNNGFYQILDNKHKKLLFTFIYVCSLFNFNLCINVVNTETDMRNEINQNIEFNYELEKLKFINQASQQEVNFDIIINYLNNITSFHIMYGEKIICR
eukprot:jgi/Orpsp1_1/1175816/evm.model.c7180000055328.1